jgi:hypothetical protein
MTIGTIAFLQVLQFDGKVNVQFIFETFIDLIDLVYGIKVYAHARGVFDFHTNNNPARITVG